jgi:hypothetical protein
MMVKRDRCICEKCGVEISGWRPWHNPWHMNDMTRHDADFHERVMRLGATFSQSGWFTIVVPTTSSSVPVGVVKAKK